MGLGWGGPGQELREEGFAHAYGLKDFNESQKIIALHSKSIPSLWFSPPAFPHKLCEHIIKT